MVGHLNKVFPTPELWETHDPLRLAKKKQTLPPMFLSCGDKDEFGFYEGATRFSKSMKASGNWLRFETVPGGVHCAVPREQLMEFLTEILDK